MARKYLKLRKVLIPTMAILMMTSQMTGCSSVEQSENEALQASNEFIEVTVPELMTESEIANVESTEQEIQEVVEVTASNGQLNNTEIPVVHEEGSYYFEIKEDGSREYSLSLITEVMQLESFEGLSEDEVITVLNNHIPDNISGDPYEDEAIRDYISFLDKEWVYELAGKELPINVENNQLEVNNTTSEVNSNQSDSSLVAESNQTNTNQTSTNQSENQTANSVQNITPSTNQTVDNTEENTLTQEQLNVLYAPGGKLANFNTPTDLGNSTGESCEDFLNHN